MPKVSKTLFRDLGEALRPPPAPGPITDEYWKPRLNPLQWDAFNSRADNILLWGEKGSGKTTVCLHIVVRHCYEEESALGFILTPVKSMSDDGGAWYKLLTEVLPEWASGLGLNWIKGHDAQHNELVWIQNQWGAWSQVKGISAPHPDQLEDRFPGREPSIVFVDELTRCATDKYFKGPRSQLGRRKYIKGPQQFLGACNPAGPSHWVYLKWFVEPFNEETGEWSPNFENYYLPVSDNEGNLPAGYVASLRETYKNDPLDFDRLIKGEWKDRPTADAIFADLYNPAIHVYPLTKDGQPDMRRWFMPDTKHAVIIGMDPGAVYNSFVLEQWLPIAGLMKWAVFDEFIITKKKISYPKMVPALMRRLVFWNRVTRAELDHVWISDNSAFNQFRAASGSYDCLEIEKIYNEQLKAFPEKYPGLKPMKIKAAPKHNGSVIARVRTVQQLVGNDQILISSRCKWMQRMFNQLKGATQKPGAPLDPEAAMTPQRCDVLHVWDGFSYPIHAGALTPGILTPRSGGMSLLKPAA